MLPHKSKERSDYSGEKQSNTVHAREGTVKAYLQRGIPSKQWESEYEDARVESEILVRRA